MKTYRLYGVRSSKLRRGKKLFEANTLAEIHESIMVHEDQYPYFDIYERRNDNRSHRLTGWAYNSESIFFV